MINIANLRDLGVAIVGCAAILAGSILSGLFAVLAAAFFALAILGLFAAIFAALLFGLSGMWLYFIVAIFAVGVLLRFIAE